MKLSLIGIRWSVCEGGEKGKGRGEGWMDGWRCWDGRGEAVGEGEFKRKGT